MQQYKSLKNKNLQTSDLMPKHLCAGSQALCTCATFWPQRVCQCLAAVPVSVRDSKVSVLTGLGQAGWVVSQGPHHLPSCRHPIQGILRGLNWGTHHSAHGCGLTRSAGERAAISLQDAGTLPVVHVVCWRGKKDASQRSQWWWLGLSQ